MDNYHNLTITKGRSFKNNAKQGATKHAGNTTKGVATCFGFKRRAVTTPSSSTTSDNINTGEMASRDEIIDTNGNGTVRTIPKPSQTRHDTNNIKILNRLEFRPKTANPTKTSVPSNINRPRVKSASTVPTRIPPSNLNLDSNENHSSKTDYSPTSYLSKIAHPHNPLQYTQLPRFQYPSRVVEPKEAKTMTNNKRKNTRKQSRIEYLPKSNSNSRNVQQENCHQRTIDCYDDDFLARSPCDEISINQEFHLGIENVNMFDLRESDDLLVPIESALPSLPSAFQENKGFGQTRSYAYKPLKPLSQKSKITVQKDTASGECEMKMSFLKPKPKEQSPEEFEWRYQAGDAMADELSYSLSSTLSSTQSKLTDFVATPKPTHLLWKTPTTTSAPIISKTQEARKVFLSTIDDPLFAAIAAAASTTTTLLEDETSPVDSLIFSYSDSEDKKAGHNNDKEKMSNRASSSDSKDINEKLTKSTSSPGTPTNASSSLSLSDGKDYFDDEIADQPALVFDDATEPISALHQNSENTPTIMNGTPKLRRKPPNALEGSPLFLRRRNLGSRTNSMDTLSPCDSITSDDLMLDFEHSQSSCADDAIERTENVTFEVRPKDISLSKLDDNSIGEVLRECLGNNHPPQAPTRTSHPARLLLSRSGTPHLVHETSSPKHNRVNSLMQNTTRKLSRPTINDSLTYDSDDSVNLDKTNHGVIVQDIVQMKVMLSNLKKILNESENINSFENRPNSKMGSLESLESSRNSEFELAELKRQIIFLQDQLEDREQTVIELQKKMESVPTVCNVTTSINFEEIPKSNAATQTERIRPISTSTSLIQMSPTDSTMGSLVSFRIGKLE